VPGLVLCDRGLLLEDRDRHTGRRELARDREADDAGPHDPDCVARYHANLTAAVLILV
jgi:hypothetical protein